MTAKLTIDKAGRVVLPKPVRDDLQLAPGDALDLESTGDSITLRPCRGHAPLRKKRGVWVLSSGERITNVDVVKIVDQVRRERDEHVLGKRR